jgi:hypothetical protein
MRRSNSSISSEILISLATPPLLLVLLGAKAMSNLLQELGQASEEVFRGDRLPVLHIPLPANVEGE